MDITVTANNNTDVTFKNCALFSTCKTEINDVYIDEANHIYIGIPVYNLIDYSNNYADRSGSLWQFKRDEPPADNAYLTVADSESFKYKAAHLEKTTGAINNTNSSVKNTKIIVPLKYLSNFWRSLEIPLVNCKIHLELNWIEDCILSSAGYAAKFKITDAESHVPIATKDNVSLTKQLSNGFKRSVFWSSYQTIPAKVINKGTNIYELLSARLQGVRRLFVLAYVINANAVNNESGIKNNRKNFLPKGEIENYNVLIDGRNFYDNQLMI